jgi:hypothetical protein
VRFAFVGYFTHFAAHCKEKPPSQYCKGGLVVSLGIEPKSRASEAPILSVVLRDPVRAAKVATNVAPAKLDRYFG